MQEDGGGQPDVALALVDASHGGVEGLGRRDATALLDRGRRAGHGGVHPDHPGNCQSASEDQWNDGRSTAHGRAGFYQSPAPAPGNRSFPAAPRGRVNYCRW